MKKKIVKNIVNRKTLDRLTPTERSIHMAKVRGKGNRSTELHVAAKLIRNGVRGWKKHPSEVLGRPDFYFPNERVALFVDGCFWHGCPKCRRNTPRSRPQFWADKIGGNRRRDARVTKILRSEGFVVLRIWEHELINERWLTRLFAHLNGAVSSSAVPQPTVRQQLRLK